jgi:diguanylate cyclase (GGDEF)-like protein
MTRRLIATLVSTSTFLALCASACALSVQAPGTQVSIEPGKGISVTAPGTQVNVGPGGTSVSVNPGQALSGSPPPGPSSPPASGPAPASEQSAPAPRSSQPAGGGNGDNPSGSSPAHATPRPAISIGSAQASANRSAPSGKAAVPPVTRSSKARAAGGGGPGDSVRATEKAASASVINRIVERVPAQLLAALAVACLIAAAMSLVWLRERGRVRAAKRLAQIDPLTGIPNRLAFENRLSHEFKRARRYDRPLGMLMLDLDGLKQVNDSKGHDAGDEMIRTAAELLDGDIRQSDLAARLAGDEFVVLCPESESEGLQQLATKLQGKLRFAGVDASIGWAELNESDVRPEDLVQRADESMYREKGSRTVARGRIIAPQGLATAS